VPHAQPAPPRVPMAHVLELPPFVDELPLPETAQPVGHNRYRLAMQEVHTKVHRDLPPTRMWTYGAPGSDSALAPVIEARTGKPIEVEWINSLPHEHFLPIDYTLHGCGRDLPQVRAVVHVHGARVHTRDDGYPTDWFSVGKSRVCHYPNQQEAMGLWYHDHAMGINRLNMYAGLFGMYLLRDAVEDALPLPRGRYELPLTLTDRDFTQNGDLYYPVSQIPGKPWVPMFQADGLLVNGKLRPYVEVEPRRYRLRVLNAANSRFYLLSFTDNHPYHVIGREQGLLAEPVRVTRIALAPGERADILVDFSTMRGQKVHLSSGGLTMLEFRVGSAAVHDDSALPERLRELASPEPAKAIRTRTMLLNAYQDDLERDTMLLIDRKHWNDPCTEFVKLGTTEIWEFVNLTDDTHPMHLHLVRFRILDRRGIDVFQNIMYGKTVYTSERQAPVAQEAGWKDVVQCPGGTVTRILVTFDGFAGKYLYHCHILEHEANDMMRPYEVIAYASEQALATPGVCCL
jgi:spore coat protein A